MYNIKFKNVSGTLMWHKITKSSERVTLDSCVLIRQDLLVTSCFFFKIDIFRKIMFQY